MKLTTKDGNVIHVNSKHVMYYQPNAKATGETLVKLSNGEQLFVKQKMWLIRLKKLFCF